MEQSGEYRIDAALDVVWHGLNDADLLARCIDGCQSMVKVSDEQFDASVKARIGPVSATFQAELLLTDVQPPESYTLNASVKGGAAGFGKGTARVRLREADDRSGATLLTYDVTASVGGKLAQVGSRLIDGAARKMADDFFSAFGEAVSGSVPVATASGSAAADGAATYENGGQWKIWVLVFIALALAMLFAW